MNSILLAATAIATSPVVDAQLRYMLRDYDSARIEAVAAPRPVDWKERCGLLYLLLGCKNQQFAGTMHCYRINAKNAYGAYTGWVYFWFLEKDGTIFSYSDTYGVREYCGYEPVPWQSDPSLRAVIGG